MLSVQPATLNTLRAVAAAGIDLGRCGAPLREDAAADKLEHDGYVDVHVGTTVDMLLSRKQMEAIEAVHNGQDNRLSPAAQRLLEDMRVMEAHQQRFVHYYGQTGFYPYGNYHATYQTTIPTSLAMVAIDSGFPRTSGAFGYQEALGNAHPVEADGQVDKYVKEAYFTRGEVASIAAGYRMLDRMKH